MELSNLIGALTGTVFFVLAILVFIFRLLRNPNVEKWLGIFELLLAVPLIWMLINAAAEKRPLLYYIQVTFVLLWLLVVLLLDYILHFDFRQTRWMVILFVVLFFAASGGLVGIASNAGQGWSIIAIILFFITAFLAFLQRKLTGK
ncbi:MAG: hypothetical protein CVU42_15205 [Chloroflexi bacterium HGW-Chloroflexi-4]|nr:MAG: hypothetical protein CVU42_15205 [Chloroflexi bacterium HGW-Chloroflexi-4]